MGTRLTWLMALLVAGSAWAAAPGYPSTAGAAPPPQSTVARPGHPTGHQRPPLPRGQRLAMVTTDFPATAAGPQSSLTAGTANTSRIIVRDDTGRQVRLAAAARRIVTLSPHATELVYAVGAGNRLVAVAPHSDYPPQAAQLPTLGGLGGLDRERLLALQPDLVVAWDSGNRAADLAWLDSVGIAVYRSEPRVLDDIARNLVDLGRLTGHAATALQAASDYRHALADACPQPAVPALPVFIQLASQPLLTVGGGHWLDRATARAGLRNLYGELPGRAVVVSRESLLARRPAVVLYLAYPGAQPHPLALQGGTTGGGPLVIGLDPALWARPGPRLPAGISALCRALPHGTPADAIPSAVDN